MIRPEAAVNRGFKPSDLVAMRKIEYPDLENGKSITAL